MQQYNLCRILQYYVFYYFPLNLVWINDHTNMVAKETIDAVFKHVEKNPSLNIVVGDKKLVEADNGDVYAGIEKGSCFWWLLILSCTVFLFMGPK